MIKNSPAVFAVGKTYQIMVEVQGEALVSVKIGKKTYYDEANGVMKSLLPVHRVIVPMKELDDEKEYVVCIRPVIRRKAYFTKTKEPFELRYDFRPVPEENIRAYHISDAHNRVKEPVEAAKAFGDIDFLILNGDVIDHSGKIQNFSNIYEICSAVTKGNIPVVFSRGNHDMRGKFAERFSEYVPCQKGKTYYTFKLGSVWGLVLDCGEDKADSDLEYGFTVACHSFRERQTDYIMKVIENAEKEYENKEVKIKLIVVHNPFTQQLEPPFDIEADVYRRWSFLLKEYIKPDLMICGHTHKHGVSFVGGENDHLGQPCPVIIASEPQKNRFIGGGFVINEKQIKVIFTDSNGKIFMTETIEK